MPESLAHNTGLAILFALGIVAASVATSALLNLVLGLVLRVIVRRHRSPLRSVGIPVVGALRIPITILLVLDSSGTVWHSPGDDIPFPVTRSVSRLHI